MEYQHSFFAEQTVLYLPHQYGTILDAVVWNFDFVLVLVVSISLFYLLHRRLGRYDKNGKIQAVASWVFLVILATGGLLVWRADSNARTFWNERLFLLAQGYAGAAEKMRLESLPVDSSAATYPEYENACDIFETWQAKDSVVANICVFFINDEGRFFYLIRPAADYDGNGKIIGELEEKATPGQLYGPAQSEPVLLDAVRTGEPQFTKSLHYAAGLPWLYAAVPIHQKNGRNDLLFVVDFYTKEWIESIQVARRIPLCGTMLSVLLLMGATAQILLAQRLIQKEYEAMETVAKNERKYNHIINNSHDAISLIHNGFLVYTNKRMNLLFGCGSDVLADKTPLDISPHFQPDGRLSAKTMREYMDRANKGQANFFEWTFLKADGSVFNAEVFLDPIEIDGESLLILVAHDLSDLRRAIRAENETRIKSNFLANISHEIRTPLTAILGYADHILHEQKALWKTFRSANDDCARYEKSLEHHSHCMKIVRSNAEFLLLILNDILDLSKIEAEKMEIENVDVNLQPFFEEIVAPYSFQAKKKGIDFSIVSETPLPCVIKSDPIRLKQVLINLIGNALKFTEKGSVTITVSWKMDNGPINWDANSSHFTLPTACTGTLVFSIKDTGIGMSPESLAYACLPFHQADAALSRRFGGTGLGLAISKRLVSLLRGEMRIQSIEGEGSTFVIALQQNLNLNSHWLVWNCPPENSARITSEETVSTVEGHLGGAQILLVEDCIDTQRLVSMILKKAGADVCIADNGSVAIEKLQERRCIGQPFDIVLMDLQMPVMDGYEATAQIRHWESLCDTPRTTIIALTANSSDENRLRAYDVGMDDFCCKPIDIPHLLSVLKNWKMRMQRDSVLNVV